MKQDIELTPSVRVLCTFIFAFVMIRNQSFKLGASRIESKEEYTEMIVRYA